jgi:vanillate O-demethylase ferredoxin subunit
VEHFGVPAARVTPLNGAAGSASADGIAQPDRGAGTEDPAAAAAGGFEILWQPTGQRVPVPPDQTAAQALMAAGLPVALSCEQGVCGSCALRVVDGRPDHRDLFFSPTEQAETERFTPCCSRSLSARLVLAPD